MAFEIDDNALDNIINEVQEQLEPVLKAEAARLNKAEGSASPEESESSGGGEGSPPAGPPVEDSTSASGSPAAAPPAGPEGGGAPSPSPAGPPGASPSPAGSPAGSPGMPADPAQIAQMMAQLPPEQVKAIYLAAKQVLVAGQAGQAASPSPAGAMPPSPSPAGPPAGPGPEASGAPPMSPPPGPPAMKAEMKPSPANGGKMAPTKKNETELDDLKKAVKEQSEQVALLTKALTVMAGTPIRKAVTSVSALAKTEEKPEASTSLSKSEVKEKLSEKIRSKSLSKKDKEAVRKFYEGSQQGDLSLVAHLLKD